MTDKNHDVSESALTTRMDDNAPSIPGMTNKRKHDDDAGVREMESKDSRDNKRRSMAAMNDRAGTAEQIDTSSHTSVKQTPPIDTFTTESLLPPTAAPAEPPAESPPPPTAAPAELPVESIQSFTTTFPEIEHGLPGSIHSMTSQLPPFPTPVLLPPWLTDSDIPCTSLLILRLCLLSFTVHCPLSCHLSVVISPF
jgi:hypothetical protein